jgi:hypothetical protein
LLVALTELAAARTEHERQRARIAWLHAEMRNRRRVP